MKANEDKQLEKFAGKLMSESLLETPSIEFTSKVMSRVYAEEKATVTRYKPLISKPFWFLIFGAVIVLMGYLMLNANAGAGGWFETFDSRINNKFLQGLSSFKFSEITLFTVALSTVMLFVQLTFLRNYFNKRVKM